MRKRGSVVGGTTERSWDGGGREAVMNHGGSAVSEKSGASTPPSRGKEMGLVETERASSRAGEPVDDGRSSRMGATEGRNDEWVIRPTRERDDRRVFDDFTRVIVSEGVVVGVDDCVLSVRSGNSDIDRSGPDASEGGSACENVSGTHEICSRRRG